MIKKTITNLDSSHASPKMVGKVITDLGSSKASGAYYIPVVILKNCEPEFRSLGVTVFG